MSVISTFNDTVCKIYVNGILKNTLYETTPGNPIGTSTDNISIGHSIFEAATGYPDPFNGIIDDIRLYNRVLTATEIGEYNTSTLNDSCVTNALQELAIVNNELQLYPNPAKNIINIYTPNIPNNRASLKVTDQLGRVIFSKDYSGELVQMPTTDLSSGIFFVEISNENGVITGKFIKE